MIVEPSVTELLNLVEDRYELVIMTSRRARQIAEGADKLVDASEKSVVTVAAKEIAEGKVKKVC
mgnify:CR=1 FL=1